MVQSCTPPVTSASSNAPTRRSSSRPTRSSGCPPPASAALICGRTGASKPSRAQRRSGTSTSASSKTSAQRGHARSRPGQFVVGSFFASDNTCDELPGRLPELLRPPGTGRRGGRAGRVAAGAAGRRHPRRHPRGSRRRPGPQLPRRLRRPGHRLVRRRRRRGRPRQDRRRGRRRRRRPARRSGRPASSARNGSSP